MRQRDSLEIHCQPGDFSAVRSKTVSPRGLLCSLIRLLSVFKGQTCPRSKLLPPSDSLGRPLVLCTFFLRIALVSLVVGAGCGPILQKKPESELLAANVPIAENEEEANYVLKETGKNIVYGEGLGEIGATILVPPYAVYKLGKAAAGLAGYELDAKKALSEDEREAFDSAYESVISVPGRAAAAIAGEDYRGAGNDIDLNQYREEHGTHISNYPE